MWWKKLICLPLLLPAIALAEPASTQQFDELESRKLKLEEEQKAIEEALEISERRLQELEQLIRMRHRENSQLDLKISQTAQFVDLPKPIQGN
ncbi:MAG: hypothetical protein ABW082_05225 [Sedimenticola sp.]